MKKSILLAVKLFLASIILMSFSYYKKNSDETKFGGSASVTGKYTYRISDWQKLNGINVGDETTINVTVDCRFDDKPAAKGSLKSEIESEAHLKNIVINGEIEYNVNACDK